MNHVDKILDGIFSRQFNLKDVDWSSISDAVKFFSCKKNNSIRLPNKYEKNLLYLQKGAIGTVHYKKDKLVCVDICLENDFFGDYQSLITSQKSPLEIVAITDCTYISIPFKELLKVYSSVSQTEIERIGRVNAEYLYILKNKEIIEMKTLSVKQRYINLYRKQPKLIQQIPLKYIAAYLSITPESMSRIRKEVAKEHFLP